MENAALLTLAGLCLGIALSGLLTVVPRQGRLREQSCLGLVYISFITLVALPLVQAFARFALATYMPLLLVVLLALPPAFYHYVIAKTSSSLSTRILVGSCVASYWGAVCIGYWLLPLPDRETMFISGDLPPGFLPSFLALLTFGLIVLWLGVSFPYLVAILRRLTRYRAQLRQLYSDAEERDLRWIDVMMVLLVLIWATGAGFPGR